MLREETIVAKRLSARLLIVQCGQLAFVCIYIFIIQLIFLQQYFPIPVPCNITRYCTVCVMISNLQCTNHSTVTHWALSETETSFKPHPANGNADRFSGSSTSFFVRDTESDL